MSESLDWTMRTHIGDGYVKHDSAQLRQSMADRIAALEAELKAVQEAGKRDFDAFQRTLHEWHALSQVADDLAAALDDFARGSHRRQFPHVTPTLREVQADHILARYNALKQPKAPGVADPSQRPYHGA